MSTTAAPVLPDSLQLGAVHLDVADLTRAVAWYERSLGLTVHGREDAEAALGDGRTVTLVLHEDEQATKPERTSGLYHYALLYPSREELARAVQRLIDTQTPVDGASDHETHEAIYLSDADGNGIELAADRPRTDWPASLGYAGGPKALDFGSLMATVAGEAPTAYVGEGLRTGHLHLHVGDIEQGLAFYRDLVGFEVQANLGSAAFVSAGGYHHHLGFNVWAGKNAPAPPPHSTGLHAWTITLPQPDLDALRERLADYGTREIPGGFAVDDPWGTTLEVTA